MVNLANLQRVVVKGLPDRYGRDVCNPVLV